MPSAPNLPDLVCLLNEVLAAARDTVARCERALALVDGQLGAATNGLAPCAYHLWCGSQWQWALGQRQP